MTRKVNGCRTNGEFMIREVYGLQTNYDKEDLQMTDRWNYKITTLCQPSVLS